MNTYTYDPDLALIFKETDVDWWGCLNRARCDREQFIGRELRPFEGPSFEVRALARGSYRIYFYEENHKRSYIQSL